MRASNKTSGEVHFDHQGQPEYIDHQTGVNQNKGQGSDESYPAQHKRANVQTQANQAGSPQGQDLIP